MQKQISKLPKYENQIRLLTSVPGIGIILAFILISEIETIERFKILDKLCSYVGLIPSTNSSGEK